MRKEGNSVMRPPMFTLMVFKDYESVEVVEVFQCFDSGFDLEFWLGGHHYYVNVEKRIEENRWVVYGHKEGHSNNSVKLGIVGGPYWPTVPELIPLVKIFIGMVTEWGMS